MSYFEEGDTVPPPFNMIPTSKTFNKVLACGKEGRATRSIIVSIALHRLTRPFFMPMPASQHRARRFNANCKRAVRSETYDCNPVIFKPRYSLIVFNSLYRSRVTRLRSRLIIDRDLNHRIFLAHGDRSYFLSENSLRRTVHKHFPEPPGSRR